ncbi:hypothetical protein [Stenotrophomonas sp. YIM B06876]|uniref:hypothetical protein n=1 Tax=Stenotrophomonas sp. YIM B06876 TaxID=3060211 RepID=UPI0027393FB9|nr:hypothetical protein [Stenotrophomonas sp. YIM B06876]
MSRLPPGTRLLAVASLVAGAAIIAGILVTGSPAQQRLWRLDESRKADLETLQLATRDYWRAHGALPQSLAVVAAQPGMSLPLHDPVSDLPYGYRVIDATRFELCATFATDSARHGGHRGAPPDAWVHPRGSHCFRRATRDPVGLP